MTRRDFEAIASVIRETHSEALIDQTAVCVLVAKLQPHLEASNPRFDARRFKLAAGVVPD